MSKYWLLAGYIPIFIWIIYSLNTCPEPIICSYLQIDYFWCYLTELDNPNNTCLNSLPCPFEEKYGPCYPNNELCPSLYCDRISFETIVSVIIFNIYNLFVFYIFTKHKKQINNLTEIETFDLQNLQYF